LAPPRSVRQCFLEGPIRRAACKEHGVLPEDVSWAEPRSRFTKPSEDIVAWIAQRMDKTSASTLLRISWRSVGAICTRVVARRREPIDFGSLLAIGVDEISFRKGQRYLTLVTGHQTGRIIWSAEGRSAETLASFFREIGPEACAHIRYVTIDMSHAYRSAIEEHLPYAKIVYDRFHVERLVSAAVDETRREEWRRTRGTEEARGSW
jgi:transposase